MPLLRTSTKPRINRIDALQKQIKWVEDHSHGNAKADANIKELKTELAELLEEEAKADTLRRLPLYSCRITAWHGMKNNDLIRQLKGNVSSESSDGSNHQELIYLYNGPTWYGDDDGIMQSHIFQHLFDCKENTPCINAANHIKNWEYNWHSKKYVTHQVIAVDRENKYARSIGYFLLKNQFQ